MLGALILPRDVLSFIFSYLPVHELIPCRAIHRVNKEWRALANVWMDHSLEDPRGIRYPIYTRERFIEKLQNCLVRIQPNQEFHLNLALFRIKYRNCPVIKNTMLFNLLRSFSLPQKPSMILNALLDEVDTGSSPAYVTTSYSESSESGGCFWSGSHCISRFESCVVSAPADLVEITKRLIIERMHQGERAYFEAKCEADLATFQVQIQIAWAVSAMLLALSAYYEADSIGLQNKITITAGAMIMALISLTATYIFHKHMTALHQEFLY